jgi:hypothetical protein
LKPSALSPAAGRSKASAQLSLAKSRHTLSVGSSMTRKSNMIPTAFSVASAIYSEIGDQPSDEFVNCPNAIPALRQVSV